MDEEEELEVHFGQPIIGPDSPQASPQPDPEDTIQGEADYATVLVLVNNLRDKLAALNLDNDNIRSACYALRRQCHSQGCCRHPGSHVRCASRCLTRQHTTLPDRARKDVPPTDRRHPYSGSTIKPLGGRHGSVTSRQ